MTLPSLAKYEATYIVDIEAPTDEIAQQVHEAIQDAINDKGHVSSVGIHMKRFTAPSGAIVTERNDLISLTWSWTDKYDDFPDVEHEVVWIKGDRDLIFGTKTEHTGRMHHVPIKHADYHPADERSARDMAVKFITGDDK